MTSTITGVVLEAEDVRAATEAGAELVKESSKSLWGYGGAVGRQD